MKYDFSDIKNKGDKYYILRDMAVAMEYGTVPADRRIQVKMPGIIVDELDKTFPNTNRSKILSQLALEAIIKAKERKNSSLLSDLKEMEQASLDDMWNYLEKREKKK